MPSPAIKRVATDSPLYELIQEAYDVFRVSRPIDDCVCTCCMNPEIQADFLNHDARDLPDAYLADWYFAAVRTNSDGSLKVSAHLWRHLLPRIMEGFAANAEICLVGIEVYFARFPTGDPDRWNKEEWQILDQFQKIYLNDVLDCRQWQYLDDVMVTFAKGGWNTEHLFQQVLAWPTPKLVRQLWSDWCARSKYSIWINAFWDDKNVPVRFYTAPTLQARLETYAMEKESDPQLAEQAIVLASLMEGCRP